MNGIDQIGRLLERILTRVVLEPTRMRVAGGVTIAQVRVLRFLSLNRGASLRDVAEALGVSNSTATELVERGVTHGYIRRVRGPVNRRVCRLTLLAPGARFLAELAQERRQRVRRLLARVDAKALKLARVALETLDRILAQGKETARQGLPSSRRRT